MLWLLLACAPTANMVTDAAPPPPTPEVRYVLNTGFTALDAGLRPTPQRITWRLWGSATVTPGQCAPGLRVCVPLLRPALLHEGQSATLDSFTMAHPLPAGVTANLVLTYESPAGRRWASPVMSTVVLDASLDDDHDGLDLAGELGQGTDPALPDTDGGGILDGQEALYSFPLSSLDDGYYGELLCTNGLDDDSDGRLDGCDDDCAYLGLCREGDCADGVDAEGDGLVDCEDGECAEDPACYEVDCRDGADGDSDGAIDCDDEDCWNGRCADAVLTWVAYANTSYHRHVERYGSGESRFAEGVRGRVQLDYGGGVVRTCSWDVDPVFRSWTAADMMYPQSPLIRTGFDVFGGCHVDDRLLPAFDRFQIWSGGWYGLASVAGGHADMYGTSSFAYGAGGQAGGAPRGSCANGTRPLEVWQDLDGDGFGVDGLDMHGALGGRFFVCGGLGAGFTSAVGDCDDNDPTWSPLTVHRAGGRVDCDDVSPTDLDGDGVPTGLDSNDRDFFAR